MGAILLSGTLVAAAQVADAPGFSVWDCFPELAGFTDPPPLTSRFPTESEQTRGAIYAWPSYGATMLPLTELIRNSVQQDGYETTVMVTAASRSTAESTLRNRAFDDDMISRITWFILPLNSIWIRDFGPEVLITPDGTLQFLDMATTGPTAACPPSPDSMWSDEVSPTRLAPSFLGGVDVFRPMLRAEGGNLQTDGQGTCVHMQRDILQANNFTSGGIYWQYAQEDLDNVITSFYNCSRIITLESLGLDPGPATIGQRFVIDHVDTFMSFVSRQTVIVARLDPEDAAVDPDNAAILERNAQTLSDAGYNVVRIPQPARYCTGSPLPQEVKDRINRQEAEALTTFQTTLDNELGPGAVTVVPVASDDMIPCQGSIHSISMTYGPSTTP